jgi:hypothetical protein
MSIRRTIPMALAAIFALAGFSDRAQAGSLSYEIVFNTSGFVQAPGGFVDIQLSPSMPSAAPASVSASIYSPITDGNLGGVSFTNGTAAGDLTTVGVTMDNTQPGNELTQDFSVGSFFDVFVTLSGSEICPGANGTFSGTVFQVAVGDSGTSTSTAMLTVNPNGGMVDGTVGISTMGPIIVIPLSSVPEPSSVVMLGLGAVAVIGRFRRRRAA